MRSYRPYAPSSTSQNPPRSSVVSPEKPCARFGTRGSAARASHRLAAAALPDQETRADRAPVFFRSVNAGPTFGFSLKAQRSHPPIAMRPGCTELHAIGACHAARDHCLVWRCAAATVSQRVRSPHARACEFDTSSIRSLATPSRDGPQRAARKTRRGKRARALAFAWACACLICGFMWLAQRAMLAAVGNARYYLPEGLQMPLEHTLVSDEGGYRGLDSQQVERLPLADCV